MSIFDSNIPFRMLSKAGKTSKRRLRILDIGEEVISKDRTFPQIDDA